MALRLPTGEEIPGVGPVVVVGPNGGGKTRRTRELQADGSIEFVNALRNTRVAPELPAMGFDSARSNFTNQKNQARSTHWELTSEFDFMLSQLLAEDAMAAKEFIRDFREDPAAAGEPQTTPLSRVEELWGEIYPGRKLRWRDWRPMVASTVGGAETEYTANQMSDGEKAALYVAGRVFSTPPGVLVVDEPETHFHSRLAVRLWNVLEDARPDLRFVYVTHDLTFALSRRDATYITASPTAGLLLIEFDQDLPDDIASALLGSATLSFYASRVVFCEGDERSLDKALYEAWFNDLGTVVRPVETRDMVMRCVGAMNEADLAQGLSAIGIVDRDYHTDNFLAAMPANIHPLVVHEIESLLALPAVVRAAGRHVGTEFDEDRYTAELRATVSEAQRHLIVIQRWKARIEPHLAGLVAQSADRNASLDTLIADMPALFEMNTWSFSPQGFLGEEKQRVETALENGTAEELLALIPGKQCAPVAARQLGMNLDAYLQLIIHGLMGSDENAGQFADELEQALAGVLPERRLPGEGQA
jgi:hypothetical protein